MTGRKDGHIFVGPVIIQGHEKVIKNDTATEIRANLAEGHKKLASNLAEIQAPANNAEISAMLSHIYVLGLGKTVCARRARKLRKRGHKFVLSGRTVTGKARYIALLTVHH